MAEENEGEDKTEEASAHKLAEARKKGNIAKTPELNQALSLIGAVASIAFFGPTICLNLVEQLLPFIAHPQQLLGSFEGDGGMGIATSLFMMIAPIIAMCLGGAMVLGVIGNVLQTGLLFTPDKLAPDFSRVNPMEGFKRMFGVDALMQFVKTIIKLIVTGLIVYMVLRPRLNELTALASMSITSILPYTLDVFVAIAVAVCVFLMFGAGLDYFWQLFRFNEKMKMSKQEVKEEYRQQEGDPHVKARLRQIRMEKSRRRMMANVSKATVVVTNPTHYAVALAYEMGDEGAPTCVAKGVDAVALKIREEAGKFDIPIIEDPPLARALYATVEIDEEISPDHYKAVSDIITFVMKRRRRGF
jgi:flagellar biosynthesis protein FlhB